MEKATSLGKMGVPFSSAIHTSTLLKVNDNISIVLKDFPTTNRSTLSEGGV